MTKKHAEVNKDLFPSFVVIGLWVHYEHVELAFVKDVHEMWFQEHEAGYKMSLMFNVIFLLLAGIHCIAEITLYSGGQDGNTT